MEIDIFQFLLMTLAVFRLTRLIVYDKITDFIRKPFHEIVEETEADGTISSYIEIKGSGLKYWLGYLLSCYWCVGIWCSVIIIAAYYLSPIYSSVVIFILAVAALAALIEAVFQRYFLE